MSAVSTPGPSAGPAVEEVIRQLTGRCPDFIAGRVLRRSSKSLVLAGSVRGQQVIGKVLLDRSAFWRERFEQETEAYRYFTEHPPPFLVPRLIEASEACGLLATERVEGQPLAPGRYPDGPLGVEDVDAVLSTIGKVGGWTPGDGAPFQRVFDYPARLGRYRRLGLLGDDEHTRLTSLVSDLADSSWGFCHGDALLSNFLRVEGGCALVDWEFAGFFLRGFDMALLWTLLEATPHARERIERVAQAGGAGDQAAFLVNLAMALTREIKIHSELPASPDRDGRLAALRQDWEAARRQIRAATGPL
jgi:Phosphotransferase enzyme family